MADQFTYTGRPEKNAELNKLPEWCFECLEEKRGGAADLAPLPSRGWGSPSRGAKAVAELRQGLREEDDNSSWDGVVKAYEEAPLF